MISPKSTAQMEPDEYIAKRVDDQIEWYSRKSSSAQRWFKCLRIFEMVAAAIIPVLVVFYAVDYVRLIIGGLGAAVAICSGILSINKYHETWMLYRTTAESLKHHKYLYLTKVDPYGGEGSFQKFVKTIEGLISKENSDWNTYINQMKEKRNG